MSEQHSAELWQAIGPTADEPQRRWYVSRHAPPTYPGDVETLAAADDIPPEKFYIAILSCGDEARDKADAHRIAAAHNNTYAAGIDPAAVPGLFAAAEGVAFHCNPDNRYAGGYIISADDARKIKAALAARKPKVTPC